MKRSDSPITLNSRTRLSPKCPSKELLKALVVTCNGAPSAQGWGGEGKQRVCALAEAEKKRVNIAEEEQNELVPGAQCKRAKLYDGSNIRKRKKKTLYTGRLVEEFRCCSQRRRIQMQMLLR